MSYILDALKRADAERERGHVPGLHTRNTPEFDAPAPRAARLGARQSRLALALALLLVLGAVMVWWWRDAAPSLPTAAAPEPPTPITQTSAPPASAPVSLPVTRPKPTDRAGERPDPAPPVLPILAPAPPRPPVKAISAAAPTAPEVNGAPGAAPAGASAAGNTGAPAAHAPAAAAPVRSFAELSPEARARLPAVNVSGSTYSKNPALRMLIINGKVVEEGGEIAPGLTLEAIAPRSAVLNHQGLRYRIGY